MPADTEFANCFEEAQLDVERREKNMNKRRSMQMWKNAINAIWNCRPIEELHKIINRQPMIMDAIIDLGGERTSY